MVVARIGGHVSAACTKLRDGTIERWHFPLLDICHEPACVRRHATWVELNTFEDDER